MPRNILSGILVVALLAATSVASAQTYPLNRRGGEKPSETKRYQESALRRFEIITLSSLPFTAIESFLVVRGVEMIKQSKFAPKMSDGDFMAVGALAVGTSCLIGLWDYLHTHDKDTSQPRIPKRGKIPGFNPEPIEEKPLLRSSDSLTVALLSTRF